MIIEIKDLGYVKNVKLDLDKDLTVLCGPNNTGKTYVAYAIYGLMKFRSDLPKSRKIREEVKKLFEKGQIEIDLVDFFSENYSTYLDRIANSYSKQISRVFASDENAFEKTSIKIDLGDIVKLKDKILAYKIDENIRIRNSITFSISKEPDSSKVKCLLIEKSDKDKNDIPITILIEIIADRISNIFFSFIFPKIYIAPAERIAINIFSKELSLKRNILVDKLLELKDEGKENDPYDLIKRRATRYPSPVRDSLEIAEDLNNFKKGLSNFNAFADEIEKEILKGQVMISREGDVQFKPDKAKSLKLPIHLTASAVKSLSNLVIYFRHLATPNDFIIIDEPELNLHPDNQVIIARIMAKIVNKGFKILISTHSDYIIREINNLIMLHSKKQFIKRFNYSEDVVLNPIKVGAILFHYESKKAVNLEVSETGFEVETIDDVINELNNRSQELYFDPE